MKSKILKIGSARSVFIKFDVFRSKSCSQRKAKTVTNRLTLYALANACLVPIQQKFPLGRVRMLLDMSRQGMSGGQEAGNPILGKIICSG